MQSIHVLALAGETESMKLLVATDLSDASAKVIEKTRVIANQLGAEVWLIHVTEEDPEIIGITARSAAARDAIAGKMHARHRKLQEIAEELRGQGMQVTALFIQGSTAEKILEEANKLDVDIIVIGTPGRGVFYQLLVENVVDEILQHSPCPVLVIPVQKRTD